MHPPSILPAYQKLALAALASGLALGACYASSIQQPGAGPRIVCDQPVYDFGTTNTDQPIKHTFVLRNAGNALLLINRTRAGCGCAAFALSTNSIPPGQTAELSVSLSLGGRSGAVRKSITLESNDAQTPQFRVAFTGALVIDVEVMPRIVNFGTRTFGEAAERYALISAASGVTFRVTGLQLDSSAFSAGIETNTAGSQYRLLIRANPDLPGGRFDAVAHVLTDHPRFGDLAVHLTQFVAGDIVAIPRLLTLYLPQDGDAPPRAVTVLSRANKPFAITRVDSPSAELTHRILPEGPARYRIEFTGGSNAIALNGQSLKVVTDRPGLDPVSIPISVRENPK